MKENIIGQNVRTFRNVIIRESEICDNVIVGDDTFISGSHIGENVIVDRRNMIFNSIIGAYCSIGWNVVIRNAEIGKYCSLAWNCTIGGAEHFMHRLTTSFFPFEKRYGVISEDTDQAGDPYAQSLVIGNDVWIAAGVQVLRGVTVGDGAVLGGGAIVTKNIPPYEIWAGVPAKKIGQRFSDELISDLLDLKWWNLPVNVIKENIDLFRSDIDLDTIKEIRNRCNI